MVAAERESLESLYWKFNEWILDYDRERSDAMFQTKGVT